MDKFLYKSQTAQHYFSKAIKHFVQPTENIYLTSPSKIFKNVDGCYESYARQASRLNLECNCGTPTCPVFGMNGVYPIGFEVATFLDERSRFWNMSCRVLVLSMKDRHEAFNFFQKKLPFAMSQLITAASRTAFYSVMSAQLIASPNSTRSLMHLDLIIFALFYVLENNLMESEIFRAYCVPGDAWDFFCNFDPVWAGCKHSWMGRFLAHDALNAEPEWMRQKFKCIRPILIKIIATPLVVHHLNVTIENNIVKYRDEEVGSLVMYGDVFWMVSPFKEFLFNRAMIPSECGYLVILIESEYVKEKLWTACVEELKCGRWRYTPDHKEWIRILDMLILHI